MKPDFQIVKPATKGREAEIALYYGCIEQIHLDEKHHHCLGCGGKDRFRWLGDDGGWICGQGGTPTGGDIFDLLCHVHGWSKSQSLKAVADFLGISDTTPTPEQRKAMVARAQAAHAERLDKAIRHECLVLAIATGARVDAEILKRDRNFLKARPYWKPLKSNWRRERLAAKRLIKALGMRYGN